MKILSAEQVAKADAYTIEHEPIKSIDLMERAAKACFDWIHFKYDKNERFSIFCGVGNNGGDGLVIARMLFEKGYTINVIVVAFSDKHSPDFTTNLQRLKKINPESIQTFTAEKFVLESDGSIIIDAIFGSGLNRPSAGFVAEIIAEINNSEKEVISIDIPSGLFMEDNQKNNTDGIVRSSFTLSLELPKLAFLFSENQDFVARWITLPIGLDRQFIAEQESAYRYVDAAEVQKRIKVRKPFSHKGTFGHALLAGGSKGMIGAAILMAGGCLRSGVGLVTTVVPQCGYPIMQVAVPEALCLNLQEINILSGAMRTDGYESIGIGPGIGTHRRTVSWLVQILNKIKVPLVLDADALNILAENDAMLQLVPKGTILTPHPGELDRLAGKSTSGYARMERQKLFAMQYGVYVVLKGRHTSIATPEGDVYFNSSGNAGMATGGSGDVLTGLITGLRAQGYDALNASLIGVYIHGRAGDLGADENSEEALVAGDLIKFIGKAFKEINKV
ncbi:MAG: NAD(P)H-hydrate dehydratase [Flavobacteriales bacterium]|nr:NAD(P)H-hydrate dehydratase [Flavobacteriales bacterium]